MSVINVGSLVVVRKFKSDEFYIGEILPPDSDGGYPVKITDRGYHSYMRASDYMVIDDATLRLREEGVTYFLVNEKERGKRYWSGLLRLNCSGVRVEIL